MTEREKVLLQREAVRQFAAKWGATGSDDIYEARIRAMFPLPPIREPRVVRGLYNVFRVHPGSGRIEYQSNNAGDWLPWLNESDEKAIRELVASPYIEVPDPEDAE